MVLFRPALAYWSLAFFLYACRSDGAPMMKNLKSKLSSKRIIPQDSTSPPESSRHQLAGPSDDTTSRHSSRHNDYVVPVSRTNSLPRTDYQERHGPAYKPNPARTAARPPRSSSTSRHGSQSEQDSEDNYYDSALASIPGSPNSAAPPPPLIYNAWLPQSFSKKFANEHQLASVARQGPSPPSSAPPSRPPTPPELRAWEHQLYLEHTPSTSSRHDSAGPSSPIPEETDEWLFHSRHHHGRRQQR